MIILAIKTNQPEAEILLIKNGKVVGQAKWLGHRQLSETILKKIEHLLNEAKLTLKDLHGVVFYQGPGSFTGLRIGAAVANSLAYGLGIPVIAQTGSNWAKVTSDQFAEANKSKDFVVPLYGGEPNITTPKK